MAGETFMLFSALVKSWALNTKPVVGSACNPATAQVEELICERVESRTDLYRWAHQNAPVNK